MTATKSTNPVDLSSREPSKVALPTQATKLRRMNRFLRAHSWLVSIASLIVTFGVWQWYGSTVDALFFSSPSAIFRAVPGMISSGALPHALASSCEVLFIGFGCAIAVGIVIGLVVGRYRLAYAALNIQITALYCTPVVALIPLMILWFGLGVEAKVVVVFLISVFPIIINTQGGTENIQGSLLDVALVEGASERQIFTKIIIPGSLPYIMTGIRLGVGLAVIGMVVAEMFTAIGGLGGAVITYSNSFATDKLLVVVIVLALLGLILTKLARWLEMLFAPWRAGR